TTPPPPTSPLFPYTTLFRSAIPRPSHSRPLRSWAGRIKLPQKNRADFMDTLVAFIVAVIVIGLFMRSYLKKQKRIEELALAAERSEEHTSELQSPYDLVCRL